LHGLQAPQGLQALHETAHGLQAEQALQAANAGLAAPIAAATAIGSTVVDNSRLRVLATFSIISLPHRWLTPGPAPRRRIRARRQYRHAPPGGRESRFRQWA